MHEWAGSIGAEMSIESVLGRRTAVQVTWRGHPLPDDETKIETRLPYPSWKFK